MEKNSLEPLNCVIQPCAANCVFDSNHLGDGGTLREELGKFDNNRKFDEALVQFKEKNRMDQLVQESRGGSDLFVKDVVISSSSVSKSRKLTSEVVRTMPLVGEQVTGIQSLPSFQSVVGCSMLKENIFKNKSNGMGRQEGKKLSSKN